MDIDTTTARARLRFDGPNRRVTERHFRQLLETIGDAEPRDVVDLRTPVQPDETEVLPALHHLVPNPPPRRKRSAVMAAAAAVFVIAAIAPVAWYAQTRSQTIVNVAATQPGSTLIAEPDVAVGEGPIEATPPVTELSPAVTPAPSGYTCGAELPFGIELPGIVEGLTAGPLPGSVPADGQLVTHAVGAGLSVEFRWPAGERPDRGPMDSSLLDTVVGAYMYGPDSVVLELFVNADHEVLVDGPDGSQPFARFNDLDYSGDNQSCTTVEMRLVDDTGGQAFLLLGLDTDPDDLETTAGIVGDNHPVVVETRTVDTSPTEALLCGGGVGDVPPNINHSIDTAVVHPEPIDALIAFLAGPDGQGKYQSGYIEFLTADGSVTYARPIEGGGNGYVTIVRVDPADGGWSVTHLTASGC